MSRVATIVAVLAVTVAALVSRPAGAASRAGQVAQTFVFDGAGTISFVDRPPAGPSPGDKEYVTERLRDAAGRIVGTGRSTCVFTKMIPNDVLERCSASGTTSEGTLFFGGVGHLNSTNPPWQVTGGTGAYKGAHGQLVFDMDILVHPTVQLVTGRLFSVVVFELTATHRLHVGVVLRPAMNAAFIRHADSACDATERRAMRLPPFPFSTFDPFHPDPQLLPQVGRFFDQPARRRLPRALLAELEKLGAPPASNEAWQNVLKARHVALTNETQQINTALAGEAPAFVRAVSQSAGDYNQLVFTSAVFGVQSCTFS
jgi:Allene oxide cyclase barrel like domain